MADNVAVTPGSGKTVLADEVTDATLGTGVAQIVKLMDGTLDGTTKVVAAAPGDAVAPAGALAVLGLAHLWNPASAAFERLRTPTIFKHVSSATPSSGNTAVWTPTSGKKFRLMAFSISIGGNSSVSGGGRQELQLVDASGTTIFGMQLFLPSAAASGMANDVNTGMITLPGNGYLSALANNVLNLNVGTTFASGGLTVNAHGTEE